MIRQPLGPVSFWSRALLDVMAGIYSSRHWPSRPSRISDPVEIDNHFCGINIATSEDERHDDYVIERLGELGITHVRMDLTYDSFGSYAERLLQRALDENLHVLLNILPPLRKQNR